MRRLILKRRKSFVACLTRMQVYIEDKLYGDTRINDSLCSKLGTLKNGEEACFSIPEEETKVFVVADKLTRNLFNDFRTIPAGDADVYLSGAVDSSGIGANPFLFDGDGGEETRQHRKRLKKNGKIALIAGIIAALAIGIGEPLLKYHIETRPRDYFADGMTITMNRRFQEKPDYGFEGIFVTDTIVVVAQKDEFSQLEDFGDLSVQEYGELAIQVTPQASDAQLQESDGQYWFDYSNVSPEDDTEYNYLTCLYKADDAFWTVQFIAESERAERFREEFLEWAATVRFE